MLTNHDDLASAQAGLAEVEVPIDGATGVYLAGTELDGAALRRRSKCYRPDGTIPEEGLHFKALTKAELAPLLPATPKDE